MHHRLIVAGCLIAMAALKIVRPWPQPSVVLRSVLIAASILEACLAIGLLMPRWRWAAFGAVVLGFLGLCAVAIMKYLGIAVHSCGCFGAIPVGEGWHLAICVAMIASGVSLTHRATSGRAVGGFRADDSVPRV